MTVVKSNVYISSYVKYKLCIWTWLGWFMDIWRITLQICIITYVREHLIVLIKIFKCLPPWVICKPISQMPQFIRQTSNNAPFYNRNVHTKCCIVGYGAGALQNCCNRSIATDMHGKTWNLGSWFNYFSTLMLLGPESLTWIWYLALQLLT